MEITSEIIQEAASEGIRLGLFTEAEAAEIVRIRLSEIHAPSLSMTEPTGREAISSDIPPSHFDRPISMTAQPTVGKLED
jgi:hypothetical protein